jgi:UDP-N-acetylglucosamine--N-acetylmuramyl-(pentapeptide) pyrophosphoryl-undecaprenol N-acetylglucosamine transferase
VNLVIAGGGTGGHLFPGVALAEEFRRQIPDTRITFIGARRGLETKVIPTLGYELVTLPVRGIMGGGLLKGIWNGMSLLAGSLKVFWVLGRVKPDLVIGVGGYASVPAVLAAALRSIPRAILEQNVLPGRANRVLARYVHRIYQGFASRNEVFPPEKTMVTGNPIRSEMLPAPGLERPEGRKSLLVLGGSQGARQINELTSGFIKRLKERFPDLTIIHQTGAAHESDVRDDYDKTGVEAEIVPFITEMADVYTRADLCLSRAGAMAISELAAAGLPGVLVPYPSAVGEHQNSNARWLEERGGAVVVSSEEATADLLLERISTIFGTPGLLDEMSEASAKSGVRDAAERIVKEELERIGITVPGGGGRRAEEDQESRTH